MFSIRVLTTPPFSGVTPSASPSEGRRRSDSIRITRCPARAREAARLTAVVVLPSETEEPVTRITRPVVVPGALRASVARRVR